MNEANHLAWAKELAPLLLAVVPVVTLAFAARTYRLNSRTKVAEFLLKLHQSFFVEATYSRMRQTLDDESSAGAEVIASLVRQETVEFTDFLNFFELVAYMSKRGDLQQADVDALFGYYLRILTTNPDLHGYIRNKSKSFEHLNSLLDRFKATENGA